MLVLLRSTPMASSIEQPPIYILTMRTLVITRLKHKWLRVSLEALSKPVWGGME